MGRGGGVAPPQWSHSQSISNELPQKLENDTEFLVFGIKRHNQDKNQRFEKGSKDDWNGILKTLKIFQQLQQLHLETWRTTLFFTNSMRFEKILVHLYNKTNLYWSFSLFTAKECVQISCWFHFNASNFYWFLLVFHFRVFPCLLIPPVFLHQLSPPPIHKPETCAPLALRCDLVTCISEKQCWAIARLNVGAGCSMWGRHWGFMHMCECSAYLKKRKHTFCYFPTTSPVTTIDPLPHFTVFHSVWGCRL